MDADGRLRVRLSVMMGMVYAVQGAFWPLLSVHLADLGVPERGRGWVFATYAIGSLAMSLGAGQFVDRRMPTQKFLSWSFGLGSILLALLASGVARGVGPIFAIFLAFWLIMAPNYSLSNSLAFRHLARPDRDFGRVRLWGTVGWMAVGWAVSAVLAGSGVRAGRGLPEAFWIASALALATAFYCRTLPDTPPVVLGDGRRTSSARDVLDLARKPSMGVYLLAAFGMSLTTPFVYQVMPNYLRSIGMDRAWLSTAMTLGQWPEVVGLVALPWLIRRLGYRTTLMLGLAAYVVRFGSLATGPGLWLATAGTMLHGFGVSFFTVGGQVFVNARASADRRASAQSINTMITGGLGSLLGSLLAGEVVALFPGRPGLVFGVPFAIDAALLGLLAWKFRPTRVPAPAAGVVRAPRGIPVAAEARPNPSAV